jgi:hypothetical protein
LVLALCSLVVLVLAFGERSDVILSLLAGGPGSASVGAREREVLALAARADSSRAAEAATWDEARRLCPRVEPRRVHTVERPVDPANPHGPSFLYVFELEPPAHGYPLIVRVAGAVDPGESSLGSSPVLPSGWGWLNAEPRGVGCNLASSPVSGALADRFHDTATFADDVVAALIRSAARSVVVHGAGYGSIVATRVAALLEARATPARAVVLEAAFGGAFPLGLLPHEEVIRLWERARGKLERARGSRRELADVLSDPSAAGLDADAWTPIFLERLTRGTLPRTEGGAVSSALEEALERARLAASAEALRLAEKGANAVVSVRNAEFNAVAAPVGATLSEDPPPPPWPESRKTLFRQVVCRELTTLAAFPPPAGAFGLRVEGGRLTLDAEGAPPVCADTPLSRPFDASVFPYQAPTLWVLGDADPVVPLWQGLRHAATGSRSGRVVVVHGAGGWPLSRGLDDCAASVLEAFAGGDGTNEGDAAIGTLEAVIRKCRARTTTLDPTTR